MTDYYKIFFDDSISGVFLCELSIPLSIKWSSKKQVETIFKHAYIKDVNLATLKIQYGDDCYDKSLMVNKIITSVWKEEEYKYEDSPVFQYYKLFVESNYKISNAELKARTPKGEDVWFLVSMQGIIENGLLVAFWGSQIDVTELKGLQNKLEIVNGKLTNKIEEVEGLAYLSSHNLQTPLHNLQNYSALLNRKYNDDLDDIGKKSINFINDSASKISKMLNRLVYYFNIDNNVNFENVDIQELDDKTSGKLKSKFEEDSSKIYYNNLPTIIGNKINLEELFTILLENSLVHNKGNKKLKVKIKFEEFEDEFQFSVTDNGIGISIEDQSRIFKINRSALDYSRGMGLAIAKKIINLHNGRIWLQSNPGQETIFFFTIAKLKATTNRTALKSANN